MEDSGFQTPPPSQEASAEPPIELDCKTPEVSASKRLLEPKSLEALEDSNTDEEDLQLRRKKKKKPNDDSEDSDDQLYGNGTKAKENGTQNTQPREEEKEIEDEEDEEVDAEFDEMDAEVNQTNKLTFRWEVKDFDKARRETMRSNDRQSLASQSFKAPDGYYWGLTLFPNGLDNSDVYGEYISLYLELRNVEQVATKRGTKELRVRRKYWLSVENQKNSRWSSRYSTESERTGFKDATRDADDEFVAGKDWGFKNLLALSELTEEKGFIGKDGSLVIRATIAEPTDWINYDSKKVTGKVGLENHGATCYLNSLLQTLYMTKSLRLAVYDLDTSLEKRKSGIGLELQRLFWLLQTSKTAVQTRPLTTAFGWESHFLFRQHDVQEMNRELVDKLEARMKGTPQEGLIKSLYTGKTRSYIKCLNVDFTSARDEEFYDIQLDVKNMKDVYQAFEKYVEEEKLEGENQYEAEGHGKQDALKGIGFLSFPPVLNLHLKRFEYNVYMDSTVKINDPFKFPTRLKLDRFLHKDVPQSAKPQFDYILHSVLVHVGDVNAGHYYAFINDLQKDPDASEMSVDLSDPDAIMKQYKGRWLKFDDERVTVARKVQAVNQNYGGHGGVGHRLGSGLGNAYMLVYVQISKLDEVLLDVPDERVPRTLLDRFDKDLEEERIEKEQEEFKRISCSVSVITLEDVRNHNNFQRNLRRPKRHPDFIDLEQCHKIQLRKTDSAKTLYDAIAKHMGLPPERIRLWPLIDRQNQTTRVDSVLEPDDETRIDSIDVCQDEYRALFVEVAEDDFGKRTGSGEKTNNKAEDMVNNEKEEEENGQEKDKDMEVEVETRNGLHETSATTASGSQQPQSQLTCSSAGDDDSTDDDNATKGNEGPVRKKADTLSLFPSAKSHVLVFFREFRPEYSTPEESLRMVGCINVPTRVTCAEFVANVLAEFLQHQGFENVSKELNDYRFWELLTTKSVKQLKLQDAAVDVEFLKHFGLQSGDILLFQRRESFLPSDEVEDDVDDADKKRTVPKAVIQDVDGCRLHNFKPIEGFRSPDALLKHLDLALRVSFINYHAKDVTESVNVEMSLLSKYESVCNLLAPALVCDGLVDEKDADGLERRILLYRASGKFKNIEQARPLEKVNPLADNGTVRKMVFGELSSSPSQLDLGDDAGLQHALFYEILPCPIKNLGNAFEVHVIDDTYPQYKREIVCVDVNEEDVFDKGFDNLSQNLARTTKGWEDDVSVFRWLVVENGKVLCVASHQEQEDPRSLLPTLEKTRLARVHKTVVADLIRPHEADFERVKTLENVGGPHLVRSPQQGVDPTSFDQQLVVVTHFYTPAPEKSARAKRYGKPFTLILQPGDTRLTVLERVKWRLGLSEEEMQGWRLAALVILGQDIGQTSFTWIEDDSEDLRKHPVLFPHDKKVTASSAYPVLGLYHPNPDIESDSQSRNNLNSSRNLFGGRSPVIAASAIQRNQG